MTEQGVRWTAEQVLALAPDEASRKAGVKLGGAGPWSQTGDSASGSVWGLCKGSGSTPYRTVVDLAGPAYKCSCPSRKFPCKHALGLLLLWAAEGLGEPGEAPDWASQWLTERAEKAARPAAGSTKPADEEAARRRAERRASRVGAGVTELEQRLADLLRGGLAGQEQTGYAAWEETAARMVDAQAPGLAARVRELGTIPSCGPGWPARMLEEAALLHLLDRAWLGVAGLPEPLAATVRTRVGLASSAEGEAVRDRWLVLAQYDSVSPDGRLTTRRIWLRGLGSGRPALVLDFGPPGRPPGLALPVGLVLEAEARFRPGSAGLRADLGERFAPAAPCAQAPSGVSTGAALEAYGAALCEDPWLESWPVVLGPVIPIPGELGWQLADAEGTSALPVPLAGAGKGFRSGLWQLAALSGGGPVTVFGEVGHRGFTPLTAWQLDSGEPVALV
ncbi:MULTISPECIES: SWIM zinc finger family protein [unclassified Streptomyces]|uniref:SWIM zinc finger family protein n=1 Tax=unclassified Streptomyces TaxID=2593676 RepID=UPI001BEA39E0|nr:MULTISPECIES: SWIM zinc finger family protein [unclassified Streptomyces]MBT2402385.1 SWIM zinc finger family protein [Streptomyces sp. ISL-21]MBT2456914.1 SWIM zinc finger family protein [Streptomyces sp. ISL-86]MBT2611505.1 SWIM zinc finger family protein [Streptomyces sp. ISL-87]